MLTSWCMVLMLDAAASVYRRAAVHYASSKGHTAVVDALLAANADVNGADERGVGPLHLAAGRGNVKMTTLLLKAKANVNLRDARRQTPLHEAYVT